MQINVTNHAAYRMGTRVATGREDANLRYTLSMAWENGKRTYRLEGGQRVCEVRHEGFVYLFDVSDTECPRLITCYRKAPQQRGSFQSYKKGRR